MRTSKSKMCFILLICLFSIYGALPTFLPGKLNFLPDFMLPQQVNLGLDLKGGASITLEVQTAAYVQDYTQQILDRFLIDMRANNINYVSSHVVLNGFEILLKDTATDNVQKLLQSSLGSGFHCNQDIDKKLIVVMHTAQSLEQIRSKLVEQSMEIVRRRVDEFGTREIDIQQQGENNILLQMPGIENPEEIKNVLGKTAKLAFYMTPKLNDRGIMRQSRIPRYNMKVFPLESDPNAKLAVYNQAILTGDMLVNARVQIYNGMPVIAFEFNSIGSKILADISTNNTGAALAIVLDDKILSAPMIKEPILGGSGIISGNFSIASANELALLLRSGALPVPLHITEETMVGPSLGAESIESGAKAMIIGVIMLSIIMIVFYGVFGVIADIALIVNCFMIVTVLSLINATLTLPGIAGVVLTLGMAVDANVLISERIREELRIGRSLLSAIDQGYKLAFATIVDSNITTVLAAVILYIFGSGPIKSFAVSLMVGIGCSMFTAVPFTKMLSDYWYRLSTKKTISF